MILRPAVGKGLNLFSRVSGAGNIMERPVGQRLEWRWMCLEGDGLFWMWSAQDTSGDNDIERL